MFCDPWSEPSLGASPPVRMQNHFILGHGQKTAGFGPEAFDVVSVKAVHPDTNFVLQTDSPAKTDSRTGTAHNGSRPSLHPRRPAPRQSAGNIMKAAMTRVLVLYAQPSDPAAFERYYFETHVPIAKKIPGLQSYQVSTRSPGVVAGDQPPYL